MGCRASKIDDLPLVIRCKERKRLIKNAADYRYDLSNSHLAYFHSLKDIGYALSKFVDEQLVIPSPSLSSSASSPVLTLPSDLGKISSKNAKHNGSDSSGSISILHNHDGGHVGSGSDSDSDMSSDFHGHDNGHIHIHDDDDDEHEHDHHDDNGGFEHKPQEFSSYNRPREYNEMDMNDPYLINREIPVYRGPEQANWSDPFLNSRGPMPYQPYGVNPSVLPYQPPWGLNQTGWGGGGGGDDPYTVNPSASQYQPPWGTYQENFDSYNGYNGNPGSNSYSNQYVNYMKKSAPASRTVIQPGETRGFQETSQWVDPSHYDPYGSAYGYGFSYGGGPMPPAPQEPKKPKSPPPPPPPMESDYLNFFDAYDNEYGFKYGYEESVGSSPDSSIVRRREGIPELEEETETESHYEDAVKGHTSSTKRSIGERKEDSEGSSWREPSSSTGGSSIRIPPGKSEGTAKTSHSEGNYTSVPSENNEGAHSVNTELDKHSPETVVLHSMDEGYEGKKGGSFDIDEGSTPEIESSILSSFTTLSAHGSRDLHEVVNEIKDEFETAFSYGKEVALMLEAGKLPYQSRFAVLKVVLSKVFYPSASSSTSSYHPIQSASSRSRVIKLAGSYKVDDVPEDRSVKLSSTLEKLYMWEKKLYKEVKDEERIRVMYEKMYKRLAQLDKSGAEYSKIEAAEASIKSLMTKLNLSIKTIDAISSEIHKVRDMELHPQVSELIYGLIRMWQSIVKCHRKQFEAIMESRSRTLRANTSIERDSSLRTTLELETGLVTWAQHFNNWINAQKSYVDSLNGWLLQCIDHEPETTIDGEVPYSPGRLGAPPIFIICNDWQREIKSVSQERVSKAMNNFAMNLRQLLERQDDIQRLMLKKEHLAKDFARKRQNLGPDEPHGSMVPSESPVDLDYKEAMKLVKNVGSGSLQGGVIPIFKALENFTCDALKAHEHVRLQ
uniref:nitrate regulatory gene2 protein-like n=1 Tax=Erigeron canadensis TaxID=72917 RepID=UPI001CB99963|nr:nitrate regulatory gene2 protein-like [Erigeron canadensis]